MFIPLINELVGVGTLAALGLYTQTPWGKRILSAWARNVLAREHFADVELKAKEADAKRAEELKDRLHEQNLYTIEACTRLMKKNEDLFNLAVDAKIEAKDFTPVALPNTHRPQSAEQQQAHNAYLSHLVAQQQSHQNPYDLFPALRAAMMNGGGSWPHA